MSLQYNEIVARVDKRLFINRLPETATEADVRAILTGVAEPLEIRLLEGRGIAFVNLQTWTECAYAMSTLDRMDVGGSQINVELCAVDKADKSAQTKALGRGVALGEARLFVGGLPLESTEESVRALFAPYGEASVRLLPPGHSKCAAGYVSLPSWGAALDAVEQFTAESKTRNEGVKVVFAEERGKGKGKGKGYEAPGLGSKGGSRDNGYRPLGLRYEPYNALAPSSRAPRAEATEAAYVPRRDREPAPIYEGKSGGKGRPFKGAADGAVPRLFLGKVGFSRSSVELERLLSAFGELTECRVLDGKGVGYASFRSWAAAEAAIETLHKSSPFDGPPITCEWARPRSGEAYGPEVNAASGLEMNRLFIGGVGGEVQAPALEAAFALFGRVQDCYALPGKGVAYVTMDRWGGAKDAVENKERIQEMLGPRVKVEFAEQKRR